MSSNSILPDTSLCAIVRDEMMNPAGGIVDFVESTSPFVEQAVILDTGSIDGTWEKLQELKRRFPNLHVFQHQFEGYAKSRNRALAKVKTQRALVLDADERIRARDFGLIKEFLEDNGKKEGYSIDVNAVNSRGLEYSAIAHRVRLFNKDSFFINARGWWYERVILPLGYDTIPDVRIWHFIVDEDAQDIKRKEWYNMGDEIVKAKGVNALPTLPSPSQCPSFKKWKALNPHREAYR